MKKSQAIKLQMAARRASGKGNTTWLLKSAIKNPAVVIVAANNEAARNIERRYYGMLKESNIFKKVYWEAFGRVRPLFIGLNDVLPDYKRPLIFDNSAIN